MPLGDSAIRHFVVHKGAIVLLGHFLGFYFKRFKIATVALVIDLIVKRYEIGMFLGDIIQGSAQRCGVRGGACPASALS